MKPPPHGEIITIGSELLLGHLVDANAAFLAKELTEAGVAVERHVSVGDVPADVIMAVKQAMERASVVVTSGGLGPTGDDVTRASVVRALRRPLVLDETLLGIIRQRFVSRGLRMPSNNVAQAMVPMGARVIPNPRGTAPGLLLEHEDRVLILLPGPPRELMPMMREWVVPWLRKRIGRGRTIITKTLKVFGVTESAVDEMLRDLWNGRQPVLALLASQSEIKVRLTASAHSAEAARALIKRPERIIRKRLGRFLFGADDESMEQVVGRLLQRKRWRVAVAESCTGGLIGHKLTNVPGSSAYFERGVVTYSNESKQRLVKVPAHTIRRYGAVSREVAGAMAVGIRRAAGVDIGLAVTGIAGPGGGSKDKPVGLVYLAVSDRRGVTVERLVAPGPRDAVKERASQSALDMLRRHIMNLSS